MGDRCKGECCERFMLNVSIEALKKSRDRHMGILNDGGRVVAHPPEDAGKVVEMAEFLYMSDIDVDGSKLPESIAWYRCRWHLPNGDCGNYAGRPHMCSNYPYDRPCRYPGCTWDAGKEGKHPNLCVDCHKEQRASTSFLCAACREKARSGKLIETTPSGELLEGTKAE